MTAVIQVGLCPLCEGEVRLRKDGTLCKHHGRGTGTAVCGGYGWRPSLVLPLTFRRWLSTQRNRRGHGRDLFVGRVARAAERVPGDWRTAEEFGAGLRAWMGSRFDDRWARYLAETVIEYEAALAVARVINRSAP